MNYNNEIEQFFKKYKYETKNIEKAKFKYIIAGNENKPCIIFLNGGMNSSEMWFKYVEILSKEYRVLIFDYPMELKTYEETIFAMNQFFGELKINKAYFIGASFGGLMAQIYTKKYPERVLGLGLFSTAGLDENTIKNAKKKYRLLPLMLWYIKHSNYEKLKPKLINTSLKKYAKEETIENKEYLREMFEYTFKNYTKEKDIHITTMMSKLKNTKPCIKEDFNFIKNKVLLIFPEKDFFSKNEQNSLKELFEEAKIQYIKNGHFGTVIEYDKYIKLIKELIETK